MNTPDYWEGFTFMLNRIEAAGFLDSQYWFKRNNLECEFDEGMSLALEFNYV